MGDTGFGVWVFGPAAAVLFSPSLPWNVVAVGHCTHISYTTSWVRARLSLLLSWWCGVWFRAYVAVVVASFFSHLWCLGMFVFGDVGLCR